MTQKEWIDLASRIMWALGFGLIIASLLRAAAHTRTGTEMTDIARGVFSFTRWLPVANPACHHVWVLDLARQVYWCEDCGYELTFIELSSPHEGDRR